MGEPVATGRVLGGRYRLESLLARGGMAAVWIAEDPILSRRVAVKLLHPELSMDDDVRARFRQEAIAAARLSHPGIVATYDTGEDDGTAYIVMELVEGVTLRALLDERAPLDVDDAVGIGVQVADALAHAHDRGIVHRDVKPGNVLVQPDGRVKVTDFGIAKAAGSADELTRTGAVIGTARYLAPEQVNGGTVDGRTDVYALGLVLYEMLTGAVPFRGETDMAAAVARLTTEPPPLRTKRSGAPEAVAEIVDRAIAREPAGRFPTADALRDALAAEDPRATFDAGTTGRINGPRPPAVFPGPAPVAADLTEAGVSGAGTATARPAMPADEPPTPEHTPVVAPHHRDRRGGRVLVGLLVLALVAVVSAFVVRSLLDDDGSNGGGGGGGGTPAAPVGIVSVQDFDPPPGDGNEHPELTGRVIDGDAATVWETERYNTPDFGRAKDGVGLVLELDADTDVGAVTVATNESGWSAQIYVSGTDGTALADWGTPVAQRENLGSGDQRFDVSSPARGRYVLVWLTLLPADGRLGIGQITVERAP